MNTTIGHGGLMSADLAMPMRKIIRRVVPLLFACYVMNFLDRINIGFAQLQMKQDLAFSDAVYGLGAGLFFIGYFFFEVPSNILLEKIGARKTIMRIMVLWGLASSAMVFVQTPAHFYIVRLLLGLFEAGFFPGIILYLTFWTPAAYRARVLALFMTALVVSGMIAGPVSGLILQTMDGLGGLRGWQWMFLVEGLPSSVLGVMVYLLLDDRPGDAKWLNAAEKRAVNEALEAERKESHDVSGNHSDLRSAFSRPLVYLCSFVYFAILAAGYIIAFWLPMTIRELGVSNYLHIGLYSAIPYTVAGIVMIALGRSSDAYNERRWHVALPAAVGTLALIMVPQVSHEFTLSMALLTLATAGLYSTLPAFWTFTTISLSRAESAAGIAIITSVGNLAGFVSPLTIGKIRTETGSMTAGIYLMAAIVLMGMVAMILGTRAQRRQEAQLGATA
ncbi:sugar phosphate permease [Bradyrhizobium sp. I1.8.5]